LSPCKCDKKLPFKQCPRNVLSIVSEKSPTYKSAITKKSIPRKIIDRGEKKEKKIAVFFDKINARKHFKSLQLLHKNSPD